MKRCYRSCMLRRAGWEACPQQGRRALLGVCLLVEDLRVSRESTWYSFRTPNPRCHFFLFLAFSSWGEQQGHLLCKNFSNCSSRALEHEVSNCGAGAQFPCSRWNPPGPGIEPMSLALAGGFLTTVPPGGPHIYLFEVEFCLGICPGVGLLDLLVALLLFF